MQPRRTTKPLLPGLSFRILVVMVVVVALLPCLRVHAASSSLPRLLQPLQYETKHVALGAPDRAVHLIKEMHKKWEGMESPNSLDNPWESVSRHGVVKGSPLSKSPAAKIGTPEDPYARVFGTWKHQPRGIPPPQMYDTFVFDPNHPFRRERPPNTAYEKARTKGPAGLWHPLHGDPARDALGHPAVVVPRPVMNLHNGNIHRRYYGHVEGRRPDDWLYEPVPRRAAITRPERLPDNGHGIHPLSYQYPHFHILNPRSAFQKHNPAAGRTDLPRFREEFQTMAHGDHAPGRPSFSFISVHEHKAQDLDELSAKLAKADASLKDSTEMRPVHKQQREFRFRSSEPAYNTEENPTPWRYYPLGRKGPVNLRGPPTRKRGFTDDEWKEATERWHKRITRTQSLEDALAGKLDGPYGHGYNHQAGTPTDVPPVLHQRLRNQPEGGNDYKMTTSPPLTEPDQAIAPGAQASNNRWPDPDIRYHEIKGEGVISKSHFPQHYPEAANTGATGNTGNANANTGNANANTGDANANTGDANANTGDANTNTNAGEGQGTLVELLAHADTDLMRATHMQKTAELAREAEAERLEAEQGQQTVLRMSEAQRDSEVMQRAHAGDGQRQHEQRTKHHSRRHHRHRHSDQDQGNSHEHVLKRLVLMQAPSTQPPAPPMRFRETIETEAKRVIRRKPVPPPQPHDAPKRVYGNVALAETASTVAKPEHKLSYDVALTAKTHDHSERLKVKAKEEQELEQREAQFLEQAAKLKAANSPKIAWWNRPDAIAQNEKRAKYSIDHLMKPETPSSAPVPHLGAKPTMAVAHPATSSEDSSSLPRFKSGRQAGVPSQQWEVRSKDAVQNDAPAEPRISSDHPLPLPRFLETASRSVQGTASVAVRAVEPVVHAMDPRPLPQPQQQQQQQQPQQPQQQLQQQEAAPQYVPNYAAVDPSLIQAAANMAMQQQQQQGMGHVAPIIVVQQAAPAPKRAEPLKRLPPIVIVK